MNRPCEVDMCDRFVGIEGDGRGQKRHCVDGGICVFPPAEACSRGGDSDGDEDAGFLRSNSSSLLRSGSLSAGRVLSYCSYDSAGKPAIRRLRLDTLSLISCVAFYCFEGGCFVLPRLMHV
jgi:hypothetical protein